LTNQFSRTELLIGKEGMEKLKNSKVIIFGIGGVGGYVAEAIARAGVFNIDLVDKDTVSVTNINRQIIADHSTVGEYKSEVMKKRIALINPDAKVNTFNLFYLPETRDTFDLTKYDYVVDAVDTVTAKVDLALRCYENNIPIISSMGAGNKLSPERFEVADIFKTSVCPLAKVMRKELKKRNVKKLKVVYSKEDAIIPRVSEEELPIGKKSIPGSISFVPSVVGLIIAAEVVKDIIKD